MSHISNRDNTHKPSRKHRKTHAVHKKHMQVKVTSGNLNIRKPYYATFKVRKRKLLFYKINTCHQKATTCIGLRAEQIFSVNKQYTCFSILGVAFTVPFLCYFQKLQLLVVKFFWANCIALLYLWAQKVCLRFLKYCVRLEILIFLYFVVPFLVDMFN